MSTVTPPGATIPGVKHHLASVNETKLHYVSGGDSGSPILLVHGWPETWWAFRKLIPLLAQTHRVFALDLRGFGDSSSTDAEYGEAVAAEDLHRLVEYIGAGPVHLLCQDVSGGTGFRFTATHPNDVASFIAVETTLAGFGLEALADVSGVGSWHVGFLGAPGIPAMLLLGHERELLAGWAYPLMTCMHDAVTDETKALAEAHPIAVPVLAIDGASYPFTENTFRQVAAGEITAAYIQNVGHLIAQEAPEQLAAEILEFTGLVDAE
jgi:pimeloyl-ACP methyl ester carboxylesterase